MEMVIIIFIIKIICIDYEFVIDNKKNLVVFGPGLETIELKIFIYQLIKQWSIEFLISDSVYLPNPILDTNDIELSRSHLVCLENELNHVIVKLQAFYGNFFQNINCNYFDKKYLIKNNLQTCTKLCNIYNLIDQSFIIVYFINVETDINQTDNQKTNQIIKEIKILMKLLTSKQCLIVMGYSVNKIVQLKPIQLLNILKLNYLETLGNLFICSCTTKSSINFIHYIQMVFQKCFDIPQF